MNSVPSHDRPSGTLKYWSRRAELPVKRLRAWLGLAEFHDKHPLEGYRRLTFMMLDADVAAASPSTVYRVFKSAGRLDRQWATPTKKGTGFVQPLAAHKHWHVDVSYVNLDGTFYYLSERARRLQPVSGAL